MARRILHPAKCYYCNKLTPAGKGFLQRMNRAWLCQCDKCYKERKGIASLRDVMNFIAKNINERLENTSRKRSNTANAAKGENNMKLEIAMLVGPESKQFLVDLTKQVDRMEALTKGSAKSAKPAAAVEDEDAVDTAAAEEDDEDFAPKKSAKGKKAAAAAFDDEDEEAVEAEAVASDDDESFMEEAPAKKAKPKKVTIDDVNDACKARAGRSNRAEVLALLKKHFKTESVTKIDPKDYEKAIKIMAGK